MPHSKINWNRRTWAIAGPIILSNLSIPLVGAVDTAVIGQMGDAGPIAAIAVGSVLFSFVYWAFGFLRMGTTGFVAQSLGRKEKIETLAWLYRAALIALGIGILLIIARDALIEPGLLLIEGSDELLGQTRIYFDIRIISAPATLINYALVGYFIGMQRAKSALLIQLVLNGSNVALDFLFVIGLQKGIAGVAWATLISEYLAIVTGSLLVFMNRPASQPSWPQILKSKKFRALIHVNFNIFLRTLFLIASFYYFTVMGSRLGEVFVAVNAILLHFQSFTSYGLDGFAHATEALAGNAWGEQNRHTFRRAVSVSSKWAFGVAMAISLFFFFTLEHIVSLMTTSIEIQQLCTSYAPWVIALPLLSVWSFQLDGIFIGTTRHREMRNAMLLSLLVYLLVTHLALPLWHNHGLWLALSIFFVARAITLGWYYRKLWTG